MGARKAEMKEVSAKFKYKRRQTLLFKEKPTFLKEIEWHSRKEGLEGLEMLLPTVSP